MQDVVRVVSVCYRGATGVLCNYLRRQKEGLQTLRNPSYYKSTLAKKAPATRPDVGKLTYGNLVLFCRLRGPTSSVTLTLHIRKLTRYNFKVTSSYSILQCRSA